MRVTNICNLQIIKCINYMLLEIINMIVINQKGTQNLAKY